MRPGRLSHQSHFQRNGPPSEVPKGSQGPSSCPHLFFPRDTWKAHSEVTGAGQKCGAKAFIRETVWAGSFRPFVAQSGSWSDSATPWTAACQAPLPMGFSRQEYWSGLPCPPPGFLPDPGFEPTSLRPPALAGRFLTTGATWEAHNQCVSSSN